MKKKFIKVIGNRGFTVPTDVQIHVTSIINQQPKTWKKKFDQIILSLENNEIDGVILFLATPLLLQTTQDEYSEIFMEFIENIQDYSVLVLIYEGNLTGNFDYFNFESKEYWDIDKIEFEILKIENYYTKNFSYDKKRLEDPDNIYDSKYYKLQKARERILDYQQRKDFIENYISKIVSLNIEISAFKEIEEVNIKVESFLHNLSRNIFFSFYVPKSQNFSEEFDQFLRIFEKYLQKIENKNFVIETQASNDGIYYFFKSNDQSLKTNDIDISISAFNKFIEMSNSSPNELLEILSDQFNDKNELLNIINDLNKKYKRLFLDLKHQKEYLTLKYNQELELNLAENIISTYPTFLIEKNFNSFMFEGKGKFLFNDKSRSIEEDKIIELVKQLDDPQKLKQIQSDLEIINDKNIPTNLRKTSMLSIKETLFRVARKTAQKVEDIGIKFLVEYIDSKINNNR